MTRRPSEKNQEPAPPVTLLVLGLIALAFVSAASLDLLNRQRGEKSYLFPASKAEVEPTPERKPLRESLIDGLLAAGLAAESIMQTQDLRGRPLIEARVSSGLYEEAEPLLERQFSSEDIQVVEKTQSQTDERIEILWLMRDREGAEDSILFSFPAPPPSKPSPKPPPSEKAGPGRVALIIDDMGNSLEVLNDILSLNEAVTIAILPFSTFARETAEIAHDNKREILLHLPLESQNSDGTSYSTDGMILAGMSEDEILRILRDDLTQIPFLSGVNNHMGSLLTAEAPVMRTIFGLLKERNLFFVDSRTTAQSVAYNEAVRMGIPATSRDVFLDADEDRRMIKSRLLELFRIAQRRGTAVGIGHPFPETLKVLKENFHLFRDYNLRAVPVSRIIR